jgi:hypothetical protein
MGMLNESGKRRKTVTPFAEALGRGCSAEEALPEESSSPSHGFDTVITLSKQIRVTDLVRKCRARQGECTSNDLIVIRSLVITEDKCSVPSSPPWSDAFLITSRNSVRTKWNTFSVIKHCKSRGSLLYIVPPKALQ